ncbi:MAG: 16S rRNA (uracil(1498)-N(3))-methyltransferase [Proteobacteria bacterium]|nr:16S rRNA (uracil(1498)-N(3))-methyltransferase [Pseudomonadota bacterium]
MRTSRLHYDGKLETGTAVPLPAESAHYLATVLRSKIGEAVHLFNSEHGEFLCHIEHIKKNLVAVFIESKLRAADEQALKIHLALGLSRGDRLDYAIQKSTELGVHGITPVYSQFGEVKFKPGAKLENKLRHWQRVAVSASEQSGRLSVPKIHTPERLEEWFASSTANCRLVLDPRGEETIGQLNVIDTIDLLIGPEGGFSAEELKKAAACDYAIVSLGARILRTETAPVAALAILQHLYG